MESNFRRSCMKKIFMISYSRNLEKQIKVQELYRDLLISCKFFAFGNAV